MWSVFPLGTNCVSFLIPIYILKDWSDVFSFYSLEESLYHLRHIFVWGGQDAIHMRCTWYRGSFKEKTKKQIDHSFNFRIRYVYDIISLNYARFGGIWIIPIPLWAWNEEYQTHSKLRLIHWPLPTNWRRRPIAI